MKRKRIRDSHVRGRSSDNKRKKQHSSSSENEFVLSDSESTPYPDNRQFPDYLNRKVNVPSSYFVGLNTNEMYRGTCVKWGQYTSTVGDLLYGYYIEYDVGDEYWMLEKDVHTYLISE